MIIGGWFVTKVTTGGLMLLVKSGSGAGPPTDATLVSVAREVALTVSVRFVAAPDGRLARLQTTSLLLVDAAGVALTNIRPAGRLSVTEKPPDDEGPKFVTEMT